MCVLKHFNSGPCVSWVFCALCPSAGWLQSGDGVLPVLHYGQFLLAAGGRSLSPCIVGRFFLFWEEVLLGLHPDWLGWVSSFYASLAVLGRGLSWRGSSVGIIMHLFHCSLQAVRQFSSRRGASLKPTTMMQGRRKTSDKHRTTSGSDSLLWNIIWLSFVSRSARCWDIIENTDVFWWIIKTPILASILVRSGAVGSLKFHYINMHAPRVTTTPISDFLKPN